MFSVQGHFYHSIKSVQSLFVQTTSKSCVCFVVDKFVMKKTGYLFHSLRGKWTLPTILYTIQYPYTILYYSIQNYTMLLYYTILYYTILYYTILYYTILYYTILYYTTLCYTILYHTILYYTILYYTILYYTILYYGILILYYTHTILLCTRCCGNSEGRTLKLPERGILLRSSAAWVLKTSIMTYQKHSYLFCIATVFSWVWIKLCSEYFKEKGQLTY